MGFTRKYRAMLGSKQIDKELKRDNIIIDPFNPKQLGPNSYDITLGHWFILPKQHNSLVSLEEPESIDMIWQIPKHIISENFLILEPDMYILAHTEEFIGSYNHATLLKSRSTFGRLFIDVCPSAGFGDIGYINRWTLEIKNNSRNHYILKPGMRIGQISFYEVKGKGIIYSGAYKQTEFRHSWKPEDMLPKIGKDRVF